MNMESNSNDYDGFNTIECSSTPASLTSTSSKRQKKSNVWSVFNMLDPEEQLVYQNKHNDTKERAKCKFCGTVMIGESHSGTSTMRRHIQTCKKIDHSFGSEVQVGCGSKKIDPLAIREKLARCVISHGYPFKIVEDVEFRGLLSSLNDDFKPICRNTCKADCLKLHKKMREKIKSDLEKLSSRICLTADMWTSCTTMGYLCLTAHFVDDDWKLRSLILNFQHVPPPHTSFVLYNKIYDLLKEWGIDRKIFSITLDNASNMDSMQASLCDLLNQQGGALLCHGKFFHIRCAAHILNLVVQRGLSVVSEALKKVRESVKYVDGSEGRKSKFREYVHQSKLNYSRGLWLDVVTRWNSTYLMLEKFLYYREAFEKLNMLDGNYTTLPSPEEFLWLKNISMFLKPFYEITTLFSGRDYPTSNLYFENVWEIQKNIQDALVSEDPMMALMAVEMNDKFCKYWEDYTLVLSFAAVLDSRFKLQFLLADLGVEYEDKWNNILEEMKLLFKEYENQSKLLSQSSVIVGETDQSNRRTISQRMSRFKSYNNESSSLRSELEIYLDEPREDYEVQLDVLDYWKKNQFRYPILSVMAKDVLSIPITTVASESAFSMGGRVINKWRNCLRRDNAEILITTRNWLYGYDIDDDDETSECGMSVLLQ